MLERVKDTSSSSISNFSSIISLSTCVSLECVVFSSYNVAGTLNCSIGVFHMCKTSCSLNLSFTHLLSLLYRKFLLGLDKFGKGDWRSISRHYVRSRTATQVASHAQKYFNRLNSGTRQRRRTSIHDITTVDDGETSAPQGPITGEKTGASASGSSASKKSTQPIPPIINVDDGDTSDLVEPVTGHMNEASSVGLLTAGMPSPSFGGPVLEPHTQMKLPSSVQGVYGFHTDPSELTQTDCFNECGFIDMSDIPFF